MEPSAPPPKKYSLKPREFTRLNQPVELPTTAASTDAAPENDVHAILRHNHDVARQAGLNEVVIREVRSRRKRDYWLVLLVGNGLIVGGVALGKFNPVSLIFGLAGVVMLTLALTWVMWFVVDDY